MVLTFGLRAHTVRPYMDSAVPKMAPHKLISLGWAQVLLQILAKNGILFLPPFLHPGSRKEVEAMDIFTSVLVSVAADVITYCICKWLDRHSRGR